MEDPLRRDGDQRLAERDLRMHHEVADRLLTVLGATRHRASVALAQGAPGERAQPPLPWATHSRNQVRTTRPLCVPVLHN